VEPKISVVITD